MRLPIIVSAALLTSVSLNAPVMSQLPTQEAQSPAIANNLNFDQLIINRRLWNQQNIHSYRYTLSRSCFCVEEARSPVVIEVRNGITTSITSADTGMPVNREYFQKYDTVLKLFLLIRDAIARGASNLSVQYDPILGYPTQINIDYDSLIADEEEYLTIENFEKIN
ncbi:MAG: hypothetical protein IGS49_27495 [Chlorogloeopsis fritschii C42_A2020_084]|uniref:DUF6174 domain-containing protein n=1 Tax=Chlorogloeopsis fritschii TaxID=1124 RepID=UPI0019E96101|nr:DUF6174 domain-containing protein [Chlorogloeopsis fritschii]MBF2009087.1 hypothetical protein [Chlorogloeopsis fritschii C42_A2020_084]